MRILVTGASGAGQTTLACALANRLGCTTYDSDDFFWIPTNPPYREKRTSIDRHDFLLSALRQHSRFVLSGSIVGWGRELETSFDLIVFLYVQPDIRMSRIRKREIARFGKIDPEFEEWASKYDDPAAAGRSLVGDERWLSQQCCTVLKIVGADTTEANLLRVLDAIAGAV